MKSDDDFVRDHIQAVRAWLKANVRVYSRPTHITIRQIQLDRKQLSGTAMLFVGDELPAVELTLNMDETGWLKFTPPLFHSPLGAPATYGAITLTYSTERAVTDAVKGLLSRLLSLGLHPKTKEWITIGSPMHERVNDIPAFNEAFNRITDPDFECVQSVSLD
jgi:hypothetical protein